MSMTALVFCGMILGSDPIAGAKPSVTVRLDPRQELVWGGSYSEQTNRSGVKAQQRFDFEARLLVLKTDAAGTEAALLTTFRSQTPNGKEAAPAPVCQLDLVHISPGGTVSLLNPVAWYEGRKAEYRPRPTLPIDELPTEEVGMFLEFPPGELVENRVWDTAEPNRPFRAWKIDGTEQPRGACCYRVRAEQESDDWGKGASPGQSFRLSETVLLSRDTGVACKVDRVIESKDPNSPDVTFRTELKYEQNQRSRLTGEGFRERYEEIRQIIYTQLSLDQLAPLIGREPKRFEGLVNTINTYEANYRDREELPYREVLAKLKLRAEDARRGLTPPDPRRNRFKDLTRTGIRVNEAAPDFLAKQLDSAETIRLKRLRGKPVVLMYVQPDSLDFLLVLQACQQLQERFGKEVEIVPLADGDAAKLTLRKRELNLKLPIYEGNSGVQRHQISRFPTVSVLDRDGVVRSIFEAWGNESLKQIEAEAARWLK